MDFSNFDIKSFIEFDEEQAGRSLDKILKKLNKNYKLKLNIDFDGMDKIGQKLNGLNKKLNKNFNLDTTGATKSVEKIDSTIGRLEKRQLNLVGNQQVKEIEHIKENLIETKKIIHDLKDGKTSVVNIEDYRKLYNELSKLQKQEFAIKERMIGKDELYTQELQKQLDVVKQQKSELQELSSKYNIKGRESFDKDLLRQKLQMQSNLDLKQQEYNKKLQEENKEIERQINNYQKKKTAQLDIFKSRYKGLFNENEATNLQKAINNIKTDNLKDVRKQFQNIDADFKKLEANAKTSSKALKSTQKDVISTTELLSNSMNKFSLWVMAGGLSMKIFHFFTGGIRYAFDFNKALTEISTVTNQNQHQVEKLANGYSRLAKSMKVTKEEVIASSIEFYRQGLSQDQVMDRVKETTKFAKVSNLEFKESAELLTATVNSMNVDITKASDVFTYIGDATATSSDEISKGFQKVGNQNLPLILVTI